MCQLYKKLEKGLCIEIKSLLKYCKCCFQRIDHVKTHEASHVGDWKVKCDKCHRGFSSIKAKNAHFCCSETCLKTEKYVDDTTRNNSLEPSCDLALSVSNFPFDQNPGIYDPIQIPKTPTNSSLLIPEIVTFNSYASWF